MDKTETKLLVTSAFPNYLTPLHPLYPHSDSGNAMWLYSIFPSKCELCEFWVSIQIKNI